ncbi:MAG TPA: MBL fold metallo-hydrolase [candidate division Zixibacteria bacterium]|nr:MBL fold metallo-hydrolase [candidate division Zixibacteria bacterium]
MEITWLGHAGFMLEGVKRVYIDPYQIKTGLPPADIVLVTHSHFDHFSQNDIKRILGDSTVIVAPSDCKMSGNVQNVKPGDTIEIGGVRIEAVPAYNIGKRFHPKESGWVGYVVEMDGVRVYHAGDTDLIPEMKSINADVALLPIGGTYTMNVSEAIEAAKTIKPKLAIPMHFGSIVGSTSDAINFCRKCPIDCKVPEIYEPIKVQF